MKTIAVVGALVASLVVVSTRADAARIGEPGGYIGGGAAIGFDNFDVGPSFNTGIGADLWIGFRISGHFALEGQVQWLPGFKNQDGPGEFEFLSYTGNLKFYLLKGRIQPHLLAGIGGVTRKTKEDFLTAFEEDTEFGARLGGGLDLYVSDAFALVGTYNYIVPTGKLADTPYMSVTAGIQFIF